MAFLMKLPVFLFFSILLMLCINNNVKGSAILPDTTVQIQWCNDVTYDAVKDAAYAGSVAYVLNAMISTTANTAKFDYRLQSSTYPISYGHGFCVENSIAANCVTCIQAAYNIVVDKCKGKVGGRAFLKDCSVRYENYPFSDQ